jgi:asparagine synthetase B (glutamine-hydrolysing)
MARFGLSLFKRGSRFFGSSDTEVMLEAISQWGLRRAIQTFNGMFAFALWDKLERRLFLARDRFGEKATLLRLVWTELCLWVRAKGLATLP